MLAYADLKDHSIFQMWVGWRSLIKVLRVGWWDLRSRPAMIGLSKVGPIHESCYWNLALSGTFVSPRAWFAIRSKVGVWCWASHEPKPLGPWIVLGQPGTLEKGRDLMAELTTMDGVLYCKWVREFGLVKNYTSPSYCFNKQMHSFLKKHPFSYERQII